MGTSFIPALLAIEPEPSDLTVVITGLLLVFLILILLTLIIALQGKFFDSLEAKKKQAKSAPAPSAPAPAKPVNGGNVSAAAVLPAPGAVTPEIVAVIAAAVASMEQGAFTIRFIKPVSRAAQASGRKAWGQAGVQSNTAPF